jgi:chromosome segregation ATPase
MTIFVSVRKMMKKEHESDAVLQEAMQRLVYIRGHIVNIFKALNKMENRIDSIEASISKIEDDMKARKEDIESIKEYHIGMEAKINKINENMQHINKVQEAIFEST